MTATMPVMTAGLPEPSIPAIPEDAAGAAADGMPPAHINGRDAAPDPLEIPEFLRRAH